MAMEWTREKTLSLIQEYRKRRGLWDMTHEDYRKKDVKHKLLGEVVVSLGGNIPIMEIEKKFHTLRTQYHREINRMKRKEPYNSKWFGFKCLQFLSSPKACRSNKGRLKAEITEDGTVTTKYIIRETIPVQQQHDNSVGSGNENEEFLTLQRRPTTITYEAVPAGGNATSTSSSRSHELEKLIEETTKDVEEIEEAKPKMSMKGLSVPLEHHHHQSQPQQQHHNTDAYTHAGASELQITNVETEHADLHHIEEEDEQMDTLNIQSTSDEELNYATSTGNGSMTAGGGVQSTNASSNNTTTVHTIPARIIKIQRRDSHDQGEYYEQHHVPQQQQQHHHQQQQQQQQHHSQQHHQSPANATHHLHTTVSPGGSTTTTTKRIYYDAAGHHTATILTATPNQMASQHHHHQQQPSGMTILNASTATLSSPTSSTKLHLRNSLAPGTIHTMATTSPPLSLAPNTVAVTTGTPSAAAGVATAAAMGRDEHTTYGEYVANEMRNITSREILIALKHKINMALFEANMQELQK